MINYIFDNTMVNSQQFATFLNYYAVKYFMIYDIYHSWYDVEEQKKLWLMVSIVMHICLA